MEEIGIDKEDGSDGVGTTQDWSTPKDGGGPNR
jgi:hypothetical protein